jgi:hypothetical protein
MWQGLIGPESFLSVITILAGIQTIKLLGKKPPIKKTMLPFFLLKSAFA